jgi:hypothetical protein
MDFMEIGWEVAVWIHLALAEMLASSCVHGKEPSGSVKGGELFD